MGDAPAKSVSGAPEAQHQQTNAAPLKALPLAVVAYGRAYVLPSQASEKEPEIKFLGLRADGWVAVFTMVLTIATILLWWATKEAISDARKASERELRAYVMVKLMGLHMGLEENGQAQVEIFNRGQTPASDIQVRWVVGIRPPDLSREEIDNLERGATDPEDSRMILGPGESRGANVVVKPFTEIEMMAVLSKEVFAYVIGHVEYLDAFGERRHTRFCHRYQGLDLGPDGGWYAHHGNSYT